MAAAAIDQRRERPESLVALGFRLIGFLIGALIIGFIGAIIIELIALWVIWPERGLNRTIGLLEAELALINERLFYMPWLLYLNNSLDQFFARLPEIRIPDFSIDGIEQWLSYITVSFEAINIAITTYLARLTVLIFSQHAAVILAIALIFDGLMIREVRRVSAAMDRSKVYHHAKARVCEFYTLPWLIYPMWPKPIDPNWIILPFHCLFALSLWVLTTMYKKHF